MPADIAIQLCLEFAINGGFCYVGYGIYSAVQRIHACLMVEAALHHNDAKDKDARELGWQWVEGSFVLDEPIQALPRAV